MVFNSPIDFQRLVESVLMWINGANYNSVNTLYNSITHLTLVYPCTSLYVSIHLALVIVLL